MDFPLYDRGSDGNCAFLGFRMCQNRLTVPVLSYILETGQFSQVIELGTQLGGLTVLLGLHCLMLGIQLDTFDVGDRILYHDWFERFDIHYHQEDIFSPGGMTHIQERIEHPGRVLVLCDNGDKVGEFATFSAFLKPNDVIGAHDYHPDSDYDQERWAWQEIGEADVQSACARYNLEPFLPLACTQAAWIMRRKAT